jgi:hypothetical protein
VASRPSLLVLPMLLVAAIRSCKILISKRNLYNVILLLGIAMFLEQANDNQH